MCFCPTGMIRTGVLLACCAAPASAQTFDTVGTRAAGMGGAFVAVADDASAAYWNPGGFAAGNYFTMVVDRRATTVNPDTNGGGSRGSGLLVALGMPALGLSYYRLRSVTLTPVAGGPAASAAILRGNLRRDSLVTHHSGVTLVQSIARGVAVGATLKLVRGVAASMAVPDGDRDRLLGDSDELIGKGSSKFDADVGVMASAGMLKAGLTVRNVGQPGFDTGSGSAVTLLRQARAGIAVAVAEGWAIAADLDLTRGHSPFGTVRDFATGAEGRLGRKTFIRGGLKLNTTGAARPAFSAGASYAVWGSVLLDAQMTRGPQRAEEGWGLAARFVY
jgi:hypothetical protein